MSSSVDINAVGVSKFLQTLAAGSAVDRINLSVLSGEESAFYAAAFDGTLNLFQDSINEVKAQVSLMYLSRVVWEMVPERIFQEVSPNYKKIAESCLVDRLGSFSDLESQVKYFSRIMKRIRQVYQSGRSASGLDLRDDRQKNIFDSQGGRCNICLYKFSENLSNYDLEDDEEFPVIEDREAYQGEITIKRYFRKPELDHVIPYILGGDVKENWQILCKSCNLGKGDSISYFMRTGSYFDQRLSDLMSLTPAKRYAVLAKNRHRFKLSDCIDEAQELRVFKKENNGTAALGNLIAELM